MLGVLLALAFGIAIARSPFSTAWTRDATATAARSSKATAAPPVGPALVASLKRKDTRAGNCYALPRLLHAPGRDYRVAITPDCAQGRGRSCRRLSAKARGRLMPPPSRSRSSAATCACRDRGCSCAYRRRSCAGTRSAGTLRLCRRGVGAPTRRWR